MKNKVIVISSYPEKSLTHGEKTVGVASYTKNLLLNLKNINFEVLAEIHNKKEKYEEQGILVNRVWRRNSITSMIDLMNYVTKSQVMTIVVPLEFYMFGGLVQNIVFLYSLLVWKLSGKKIILILHQVVLFVKIFYLPLIFLSEEVVVFEEKFRKVLGSKKVVFIPHAVESVHIEKTKINKKFSALYFGFLSPYKGVKELINLWDKKFGALIIAGGGNPNHMKNKRYFDFLKNIKATGFVPEDKIADYFSKTNLVILPYKMFFSSSGPLSLAFSFEKPFILSKPLEGYFDSPDFDEALKETGLKKEDFLFDFNSESFENRLNWAKKNLNKLTAFSRIMKEKRAWKNVAKQYETLLK